MAGGMARVGEVWNGWGKVKASAGQRGSTCVLLLYSPTLSATRHSGMTLVAEPATFSFDALSRECRQQRPKLHLDPSYCPPPEPPSNAADGMGPRRAAVVKREDVASNPVPQPLRVDSIPSLEQRADLGDLKVRAAAAHAVRPNVAASDPTLTKTGPPKPWPVAATKVDNSRWGENGWRGSGNGGSGVVERGWGGV